MKRAEQLESEGKVFAQESNWLKAVEQKKRIESSTVLNWIIGESEFPCRFRPSGIAFSCGILRRTVPINRFSMSAVGLDEAIWQSAAL